MRWLRVSAGRNYSFIFVKFTCDLKNRIYACLFRFFFFSVSSSFFDRERNSRGKEKTSEEMLEAECRDFLPLLVKEHAVRSFLIQRN